MQLPDPEAIELPLLLEAMVQSYGYDFRDYAAASLKRRLRRAMDEEGLRVRHRDAGRAARATVNATVLKLEKIGPIIELGLNRAANR